MIDLSQAVVAVPESSQAALTTAAAVLVEEVGKRTGIRWQTAANPDAGRTVIALAITQVEGLGAEGFRIRDGGGRWPGSSRRHRCGRSRGFSTAWATC